MTLTAGKILKEAIHQLQWQELKDITSIIGMRNDISNEVYHGMKSYLSRSLLMDFDKSPYTYWAKHINTDRAKKDATASMKFGSAFHALILEPDKFNNEFAMLNRKVLLKDVGRDIYENFKKQNEEIEKSGKIILTDSEWRNLFEMKDVFYNNIHAIELIEDSRIENSFFWQDEHSGLLLKARPDILHENMIVDLKTTSDASPLFFQREMVSYGYHVQFAMIRDAIEIIEGRRINNFINIVIETKYPYNMAIYIIDEYAIEEGQRKYKQICLDMKKAIEEDNFPDYGIQKIGLPKWAT